jgi:hypothetical protein
MFGYEINWSMLLRDIRLRQYEVDILQFVKTERKDDGGERNKLINRYIFLDFTVALRCTLLPGCNLMGMCETYLA